MGYQKTALKSIGWATLLRIVTRGFTFVRLAILGRVLTPIEFGYFGIASLLLSLLEIFTETGINVFLIQHKGHIREYIDSAWVVSILRGIVLSLLIFLSAPFVAAFFNSRESTGIISLIAIVPLIRGFINPAIITYQKDLTFNKEFNLRSVLFVIDVAVSIVVGFIARSAIGFVYGQIASAIAEVVLSFILISVRPKFNFEFSKIKHVFDRGIWVTLTGIFSYFADNGDNIAVGKILGSQSLGVYQVAYKFSTLPISEIANVLIQVVFPVYSKFSDDKNRLKRAFLKVTFANSLGAIILGVPIFIFAQPIILLFMGDQWISAVPAIQILAVYGILRTMFGSFSALFLSLGRQDYVAKMLLARVVGLLVIVVPLVSSFGMVGAGFAMLASVIIETPVTLYFTYKVFNKPNR